MTEPSTAADLLTAALAAAALFTAFVLMARMRTSCLGPERCESGEDDPGRPRCGACPRARTESTS